MASGWANITILNISSRGLMARTDRVPNPRTYVEIRRGQTVTIVGKVVWQDDQHFGVRTQDRISLAMISDGGAVATEQPYDPAVERRGEPREGRIDPVEAFERNRRRAALGQFAALAAGGATLCFIIASMFVDVLGDSVGVVASHLG